MYDGSDNNLNKPTSEFQISNRSVTLQLRKSVRVCDASLRMLVSAPAGGIEPLNVFVYEDLSELSVPMHCIIVPNKQ